MKRAQPLNVDAPGDVNVQVPSDHLKKYKQMKKINIKLVVGTALLSLFFAACSDLLEETPRSTYTPEFFKSEKGVQGGITSLYTHLRYMYGQAYYYNSLLTGTDEVTYAQSADANFKDMDMTGVGSVTAQGSRSDVLWNTAFPNINTASGIIENAMAVSTIPASLIAEARFFRAFDYFMLVQTFGGVPLDLGAGVLKFNTTPVRTSKRNTVPEVYTQAIFPDLKRAIEDLPEVSRMTGTVTKTVARLYLAKAYLTYGWWLQNPNNIPTYPAAERVDPDGKDAAWYFQQAYDVAVQGIENPGSYGLLDYYYDVNLGSNDRNKEILLYADHTEADEFYNASSLSWSNGAAPENFAGWMMTWNYTNLRSGGKSSVQREAVQALGRPWTRMSPTINVVKNTFADKTNDSRYDGTFTYVYRANFNKGGIVDATLANANGMPVAQGEAVLTFLHDDVDGITYAEAAVKGATPKAGKSARELINVIRARAGKWRWYNNGNVAKVADNSAAMIAATPAVIDINYILAERSREFYGEGYRWHDLVRTQKWEEIAGTYQICGTGYKDRTPQTFTRTIEKKHYLRPIPQGQLDGMEMSAEDKVAYQNPGY